MKFKKLIIISLVIGTLYQCDDGFEELNENPLNPTSVSIGALFNEIVNSLRLEWSTQLFIQNEVLYNLTEQGVVTAQTFGNLSAGTEELWSNYYKALNNANHLKEKFKDFESDPQVNALINAQLDIIMAYKTFQITDLFGDIPYSEAGRSFDDESIIRPKYDAQSEIYFKLINDLQQASKTLLSSGKTDLGNDFIRLGANDQLFNDNLDLWVRFSNSLMLRHLVRMYEVADTFAAPRIKELIESGANLIVKGQDVVMSPRSQNWSNLGVNWSFREHNKLRLGTTMWDFCTENNEILDHRINIFFEPNNANEWVPFPQIPNTNTIQSGGEPYSKDNRDANYTNKGLENIYSSFNFYLVRDELDIPEIMLTAAEVQLLKAEIFLKGMGVTPDVSLASSAYTNGVFESLEYWQKLMIDSEIWQNKSQILSTGELFGIALHPKYAFNTSDNIENNFKKIVAQRWMDSFRQPVEAYSLKRRTSLTPTKKSELEILRLIYPPSESALNNENYQIQSANMGGDNYDNSIWWMK